MSTPLKRIATALVCLSCIALLRPPVSAQARWLPWTDRDRVLRAFDEDTAQAINALEQTVFSFCESEKQQAAFIDALETNLFPPKTGAARVQALEALEERVARELGPDSPILTTINAEKASAETAVRIELERQKDMLPAEPAREKE